MKKFATLINCMDGRVQLPAQDFIKNTFGVDFVDTITLPGANKIIAEGSDKVILEFVKRSLEISIDKHGSSVVAVAGHYDCAGNPSNKETQKIHIIKSLEFVKNLFPYVQTIGLWIDENLKAEKIV